jgi:transposase-like protein
MIGEFIQSEIARSLTPDMVAGMNRKQARAMFQRVRWPETFGKPVCPRCGGAEAYVCESRPLFKCKQCQHQFSLTSGTIFSGHKMPLKSYLMAMALLMHDRSNSLKMAEQMDVQYGTAYRLSLAIRAQLTSGSTAADTEGSTRATRRANERCKRCNRSRKEMSRFPNNPAITGISFCKGYCPKCYQLRLTYKQNEDLCELHELTQILKRETRDGKGKEHG